MSKSAGFTLIELMIAVAIVGILTMVAYPAYQDSIHKTRRSDAVAGMLGIQVAQEKFRGNCPYYAQSIGAGDVCGANAGASTVAGATATNEGYYTISIEAASASGNSYTIVATAIGSQVDDTGCTPLKITFNNVNPNGAKTPVDCW